MFVDDVRRLGADVEETWDKTGDDPGAFPEIASTAMERHGLHEGFNDVGFATWFGRLAELPCQFDSKSLFGAPSIALWGSGKFVVEIYFTNEPDAAIHDHNFSGAFGSLIGEAIHCVYRLAGAVHPEPGITLTRLDLEMVEQLREGMVRTIHHGRRLVHRVWHIGRPTVGLCVRTISVPLPLRQYAYYPPGFGIEVRGPLSSGDLFQSQMTFMHFLADTSPHQLEWYIEQVIDHSRDPRLTFNLVLSLFDRASVDIIEHLAMINRLLERLQYRYGAWVDAFGAALEHRLQEKQLLWHAMHDGDHRLLAVLLQTHGERSAIDDAIRRFRDVDRTDIWIADRLTELIEQGGIRLCMDGFQYGILRDVILGRSETEAIAVAMSRSNVPTSASQVREFCAALRQVDILQPLIQK